MEEEYRFPHPFKGKLAFSYAGLRSELTRILVKNPVETMSEKMKRKLAKGFMVAGFKQVEEKVELGWRQLDLEREGLEEEIKGLVVSGGVASNTYLRTQLSFSPLFLSGK